MKLVPVLTDAVPVPQGANLPAFLAEAAEQGVSVALSPEQVRSVLEVVLKLYEFNREGS